MKKIKYVLLIISILCLVFILNIKIIKNKYGTYSVFEITKIEYMAGTIELNNNPYFDSLGAALSSANLGDTIYIGEDLYIDEDILIPNGIRVEIKAASNITIAANRNFKIEGTLYQNASSSLNVSGNIQIGYDGLIDTYGIMNFFSDSATLETYSKTSTNPYGTIILRNGSSFIGDENFVNVFENLENVKIENYGATITDKNVITLFRDSNIITSHGLHVIDTQTYYDSFNDIPKNANIELTTFLYLTEPQTIKTGVTVNVLANKQIVVDAPLTINGTLTMNENYLEAEELKGNGSLRIHAAADFNKFYTKTSSLSKTLNIYLDGEYHYGYNLMDFGAYVENPDKLLENFNLKTALTLYGGSYYSIGLGTHTNAYGEYEYTDSGCIMDLPCEDYYTGPAKMYYISIIYQYFQNKALYECVLDEFYYQTVSKTNERPEGWHQHLTNTQFNSINTLDCSTPSTRYDNSLLNLTEINKLTNLKYLTLNNWSYITSIDLSSLSKLEDITIEKLNNLNSLTLDNAIKNVSLNKTNIQTLDLTNKNLNSIYLANNKITSLNLSASTSINSINATFDTLSTLNMPTNLNNLGSLKISQSLTSTTKPITSLDLSTNTKLYEISLINVGLNEIKLSNSNLKNINLSNNNLSKLQILKPDKVERLTIPNNNITNANFNDFDDLESLRVLDISNNKFTSFSAKSITDGNNLTIDGNPLEINIILDETKVGTTYDYSNDYFEVGFEQELTTDDEFSLTEGLNTLEIKYTYEKYFFSNLGHKNTYDYPYTFTLNVTVPNIKSENYVIDKEKKAIYIDTKDASKLLDNITKTNVFLTKNNNKLELRHNELDQDAFSTYDIIGYQTEKEINDNTISYVEKTKVSDILSTFDKVGDIEIGVYDKTDTLIEDTSSYASTGMKLKFVFDEKVYDSINISVEYLDVDEIYVDTEEGIVNVPLEAKKDAIEAVLQTSGIITYYDEEDSEITLNDDEILKTGYKVKVTLSNKEYNYYLSVKGDVTGSGASTISDVMRIISYILDDNLFNHNCYYLAADMNKDGNVSISDVMVIVSNILG